jgi:predicted dehydrogenase
MARWHAALIGCGDIGVEHAEAVARMTDLEFVTYCDLDLDRARAFLARFGGRSATDDVQEVLDDADVDIVYVCTQHDSHVELCVAAARAGKHILAEKPLALTVEGCLEIARAVEEAGVTLMTGFKLRFYELVRQARELMPEPLLVSMQMMYDRGEDDRWVQDPVRGGGGLLSAGVHAADLLRYVSGGEPSTVMAAGQNYYHRNGLIDNIAAVYTYDNGVTGSLVYGDCCTPPGVSTFHLQMFAERRSIVLSDRLSHLAYREMGRDVVIRLGSETGVRDESAAFVAALDAGTRAPVDHRDGTLATHMILQAVESARTGTVQAIHVPGGAPASTSPVGVR